MKQIKQILIVDDDVKFHNLMKLSFGAFQLRHVHNEEQMWSVLKGEYSFHLLLLDLDLKEDKNFSAGLPRIQKLKKTFPDLPIIVVTKAASTQITVEAMKYGADYYLSKKEFDYKQWQKIFIQYLEPEKNIKQQKTKEKNDLLIGNSATLLELKETLQLLGKDVGANILLTGETGVGKSLAAKFFHQNSTRAKYPYVEVHLASENPATLSSALFGHKKGAYTDAKNDRLGYFREADKGVLFLDEIGEISQDVQIQLLKCIEDKKVIPMGTETPIKVDVQIITATNKDLKQEVKEGRFRADLYHRINGFSIKISPLRDREEDILSLMKYFLNLEKEQELNLAIEQETLEILKNYEWPGNIRQLQSVLNQANTWKKIKKIHKINKACLPNDFIEELEKNPVDDESFSFEMKQAKLALTEIDQALAQTNGRKGEAAKIIKTDSDGLMYMVKKYNKRYPLLIKSFTHIKKYYHKVVQ